jgi:signal transduction histidine kinase
VVSLILRFHRSRGDERQQIKWLAYVAGATVICLIVVIGTSLGRSDAEIETSFVSNLFFFATFLCLAAGIPAASAIAMLKYRLYDLDVVVKKAVVFAVLVLFVTAVYFGVVLGLNLVFFGVGGTASVVTFVATVIVALLYQRVQTYARRFADRIVYGRRATPYEVLSEFSDRLAGSYSADDVLPRMAQIMASGTGATRTGVWLRVGPELRPAASWPDDAEETATVALAADDLPDFPDVTQAFPVNHQGELLGALTLTVPPNDPLTPSQEKLVRDMAAQAGLVLRNVRLIQELRASRQRLVAAQDEERRKLERNIHDGAQQQLVALSVKMRLAETLVERDPATAREVLGQVRAETNEALEELRDLARGVYPPLLADEGLLAALQAQARKSPVPARVEGNGIHRYSPDVEATVYFCALEALQNVAKHADASQVSVSLSHSDGELTFTVLDDGRGFESSATGRGTGLQGMADRLDAVGGRLRVESSPGGGTTVSGSVPARENPA